MGNMSYFIDFQICFLFFKFAFCFSNLQLGILGVTWSLESGFKRPKLLENLPIGPKAFLLTSMQKFLPIILTF